MNSVSPADSQDWRLDGGISVIIPTFNRAKLLCRALDSVIAQSTEPTEVIVVDDGSEDNTANTVRRRYRDVIYIYQPNRGVSGARNRGLATATGEWIAFLDSDDEWLPAKLTVQSRALATNTEYQVCHTNEIWIRNGRRVNPMRKHEKYGGWIYEKCLPLCVISPSSVLIRRAVFEEVGYFDEELPACEDYDLWLRICAAHPVLYLDQCLLRKYGGHSDQLSKRFWGMDRFRVIAMEKMLADNSLSEAYRAATTQALLRRLEILLTGARKYDNTSVIDECSRKIEHLRRTKRGRL